MYILYCNDAMEFDFILVWSEHTHTHTYAYADV